jgi:SAM-dependent methyltransferase
MIARSAPGAALLQTEAEWSARNDALVASMCRLIAGTGRRHGGAALDVGCQTGALTDGYAEGTGLEFCGVDPIITELRLTPGGRRLLPGVADDLPFPDATFDVVVFSNVFEHVRPDRRLASLVELRRVLRPDGVIVGQIPNPWFPIESHSRLPFMGWLPERGQQWYWRFSPTPWGRAPGSKQGIFYSATTRHVRATARAAGLRVERLEKYNYPLDVIPERLRPVARLLRGPMRILPWSWLFVLVPER